jgi:membrane protein DedA with SNARE-associated domain
VGVHSIFLVCFLAVLVGDIAAFGLGRYFGPRLLSVRFIANRFTPRKQRRVRAYFRRFGSKVIFIGRFLPGLRFSIFFSAGMLHVRLWTFIKWDGLAALLSVPALVYMAFFFGDSLDVVINWAHRSEYGILIIAAVVASVFLFKMWRKKRRLGALEAATPPETRRDPSNP